MIALDVTLKGIKGLEKYLNNVERDVHTATTRAINKTAAKAKTAVVREIAQDIGMVGPVKKKYSLCFG